MNLEGILVDVDGRPALRFERRYLHPVERVWRAITDPEEMAQWFPSNVEGERKLGAELVFMDEAQRAAAREAGEPTRADGPVFRGEVLALDPPTLFSFTWGGEVLRLELASDGGGTNLIFTHILSHQSVAARNGAGWHVCLAALDRMLDGPDSGSEDTGFGVYHDYLRRMGPSLGRRTNGTAMTWERSTHVDPERVREVTTNPSEMDEWGAGRRPGDPLRWEIQATDHGTLYRLTHEAVGDDAALAAIWHALLLQLDMYLAAGQLIPIDHQPWIASYTEAMSAGRSPGDPDRSTTGGRDGSARPS
jgi:uncharacterized protein YndB with AHSA1/START domain